MSTRRIGHEPDEHLLDEMAAPCGFCEIVFIALESPRAGWTRDVISISPVNPCTPGHRVFIPAKHVTRAEQDSYTTSRCFEEAARWARYQGQPGQAFNLIVQSGQAAGQRTEHMCVHYIPRTDGDGLGFIWKSTGSGSEPS